MKLHISLSNGRPFTSFTFTIQPIHRCHSLRRSGQPIALRGPAVEPFHFLVGGSFGIPVALGPNLDQNVTTTVSPAIDSLVLDSLRIRDVSDALVTRDFAEKLLCSGWWVFWKLIEISLISRSAFCCVNNGLEVSGSLGTVQRR